MAKQTQIEPWVKALVERTAAAPPMVVTGNKGIFTQLEPAAIEKPMAVRPAASAVNPELPDCPCHGKMNQSLARREETHEVACPWGEAAWVSMVEWASLSTGGRLAAQRIRRLLGSGP